VKSEVADGDGAVGDPLGDALGDVGDSLGVLGRPLGDGLADALGGSVGEPVGDGDADGSVELGVGEPAVGCPVGDGGLCVEPGVGDEDPGGAVDEEPPLAGTVVLGWISPAGAAARIATISLWTVSSCSMIWVTEYEVIVAANSKSWFQTAPRARSCSSPGCSSTVSTSWLAIAAVMHW
jgi:hypothetical protein